MILSLDSIVFFRSAEGSVLSGRKATWEAALNKRARALLTLLIFTGSTGGFGKARQGSSFVVGDAGAFGLSSSGLRRVPEMGLESDDSKLDAWRLKEEGGLFSGVLEDAGPNSFR